MERTLQKGDLMQERPSFNILEELREAMLPSFTLSSLSRIVSLTLDEAMDVLEDMASGYSRDGFTCSGTSWWWSWDEEARQASYSDGSSHWSPRLLLIEFERIL